MGAILKFLNFMQTVTSVIHGKLYKKAFKEAGAPLIIGKGLKLINPHNISIGNNFSVRRNVKLQTWEVGNEKPLLIIGNDVAVMDNCQISCAGRIVIGDGVLLGDNVFITDNFHGKGKFEELRLPPHRRDIFVKGKVQIGNNVWIGRNVSIMPGVIIGDGAIVGANAVVTRNVKRNCVVAGVPAKTISVIKKEAIFEE